LGITIAGYTCEREELSGIFVKSVTEGSSAHRSGRVAVNDQIVEVDGHSIQGYSNQQAVEMLRSTGRTVKLKLVRYVHGLKFEQLQQAIAHSQSSSQVTSPATSAVGTRVASPPAEHSSPVQQPRTTAQGTSTITLKKEEDSQPQHTPEAPEPPVQQTSPIAQVTAAVAPPSQPVREAEDFASPLTDETETRIVEKWSKIMGPGYQIIPAQLRKFKANGGLGISLEGTVEKVDGEEQNPHHYIRSVLPNGPVGQNGRLKSGDELLEVNGRKLLGLYHTDVVAILKDLPMNVRMVCARSSLQSTAVGTKNDFPLLSGGSGGGGAFGAPQLDRLVKAKSDGSISSAGTTTDVSHQPQSGGEGHQEQQTSNSKLKSRSLEPLTSLAMWSEDVAEIELVKGDRGLGFSILDYQDPLNKEETVIVIRSLGRFKKVLRIYYLHTVHTFIHDIYNLEAIFTVPGGIAQQDGRLIPGDRLMYVNDVHLAHASLDDAVQALKGAARGIVRIGVAKPMPAQPHPEGSMADEDTSARSSVTNGTASREEEEEEEEASEATDSVAAATDPRLRGYMGTLPELPADDEEGVSEASAKEKDKRLSEPELARLPTALEQHIRVIKDSETLGVQVTMLMTSFSMNVPLFF